MQAGIASRRSRYVLVVLLALTINIIAGALTRSIATSAHRMPVAIAASFDVVVLVTAIYYWLLIRPGIQARWSLVPVALAGILHATYLYPNAALERAILTTLCEVGLLGYAFARIRRAIRRGAGHGEDVDPVQTIRETLASVVPVSWLANLCAVEFAVLYYALFSWRAKPHVPSGAKAFSIHKRAAEPDLWFALAIMSLVEILPVHLLLSHWSALLAWIATGVSLYGAVWFIGIARSIELRPALIDPDYLDFRYGLLFRLRIPREMIHDVHRIVQSDLSAAVIVPRRGEPNLCVELRRLLDAERLFGMRRDIRRIAFTADEVDSFLQALEELPGEHEP